MLYLIVITDVVTTFAMKNSIGQISHLATVMLTSVPIVSVLILSYYPSSAGVCKISCLAIPTGINTTNTLANNVTNANDIPGGKGDFNSNSTVKNVSTASPESISKVNYNNATSQPSKIITTSMPLSSNLGILPHFTNATLNGSSTSQNTSAFNSTSNQSLATLYNKDPNDESSKDSSNGWHTNDHHDDSNDNSHSSDSSGGSDNQDHKSHKHNNNDKHDRHHDKDKHHTKDKHGEDATGDNGKPGKAGDSGKSWDKRISVIVHKSHSKLKVGLVHQLLP